MALSSVLRTGLAGSETRPPFLKPGVSVPVSEGGGKTSKAEPKASSSRDFHPSEISPKRGRMAKDVTGSELRDILTEILGEEAVVQKTSGYIVQGVTLKA